MRVTNIKQQVARPNRYSVFIDGIYTFSLSDSALLGTGLYVGRELSDSELRDCKKTAASDASFSAVLRYVAQRPHSRWEVEQYLKRKKQSVNEIDSALSKLESLGLVNDRDFAQSWVAQRRLLKSVGRQHIYLELRQKRVSEEIIAEVLDEDETDDRVVVRRLVQKKGSQYNDKQKMMAYLARRGFKYDDIKAVLEDTE